MEASDSGYSRGLLILGRKVTWVRIPPPPLYNIEMENLVNLQNSKGNLETQQLSNWLDREIMFRERDLFVSENKRNVELKLIKAGYKEDFVGEMAVVCLRGAYVFNMVCDLLSVNKKIKTSLTWEQNLHPKTRGQAVFQINVEGEEVKKEPIPIDILLEKA